MFERVNVSFIIPLAITCTFNIVTASKYSGTVLRS